MILTALEIKNLAEYALGITIDCDNAAMGKEEMDDYEYSISCNVKVRDDDGKVTMHRRVVSCDGCEFNECSPISGEE